MCSKHQLESSEHLWQVVAPTDGLFADRALDPNLPGGSCHTMPLVAWMGAMLDDV